MKLMHIADLHLGAPCGSYADAAAHRARVRDGVFTKLIDIAVREADMLIISGDLFDNHRPERATVSGVLSDLSRFKAAGGLTLIVPGNHDEITYADSVYRSGQWDDCCLLVKEPKPYIAFEGEVAGERIAVCSCAYTGGVTKAADLEKLPAAPDSATGIVALHACIDIDFPGIDEDRAMKVKSTAISDAGYSYAALGHIHKKTDRFTGSCRLVYPGMIEPAGFADAPEAGCAIVGISEGIVSLDWRQVPGLESHKPIRIDVTGKTADGVIEEAKRGAAGADYLYLELYGTSQEQFSGEEARKALLPLFKAVKVSSAAVSLDMGAIRIAAGENSVRGAFIKNMVKLIDGAKPADKAKLESALWKGLDALREGGRPW